MMNHSYKITRDEPDSTLFQSTFKRMFARFSKHIQQNILNERCMGSSAASIIVSQRDSLNSLRRMRPQRQCRQYDSWKVYATRMEMFIIHFFDKLEEMHPELSCTPVQMSLNYSHDDLAESLILCLMMSTMSMVYFFKDITTLAVPIHEQKSTIQILRDMIDIVPRILDIDPVVEKIMVLHPCEFLLICLFDVSDQFTLKELCHETSEAFERQEKEFNIYQNSSLRPRAPKSLATQILTHHMKSIIGLNSGKFKPQLVDISSSDDDDSCVSSQDGFSTMSTVSNSLSDTMDSEEAASTLFDDSSDFNEDLP